MSMAFTVIRDGPKDGKHWRLVLAYSTGGYSTLKEVGDPTDLCVGDPTDLCVAKGPTWFETSDEANDEADVRNHAELGLTFREAMQVKVASMSRPS